MRAYPILLLLLVVLGSHAAEYREDQYTGEWATRNLDNVDQWGLEAVGLDATLRRELATDTARAPVIVAVIDTGLDYDHPDLAIDNLWMNTKEKPNGIDDDGNGYIDDFIGWDFVDGDNDPWDWVGHGTHVAGVIAAHTGDGVGTAGIDARAQIMALRALNTIGRGWSTRIERAIRYAVDNGAKVINLSMSVKDVSEHERRAITYAFDHDVLVVVAAGNAGDDTAAYTPASIEQALTVAAFDRNGERASFSNWGAAVDVAAPGTDILSLRAANTDLMLAIGNAKPLEYAAGPTTEYYRATGTSFAAPFVTGIASLIRSRAPELHAAEVKRMIEQSADDVGSPGIDQYTGYGRANAKAALAADPRFYIEAAIGGVRVTSEGGKPRLEVTGTAAADQLSSAWIEIGAGDAPTSWKKVSRDVKANIEIGVIDVLDAALFAGSKQWTLRVVAVHQNGKRREARFLLTLG